MIGLNLLPPERRALLRQRRRLLATRKLSMTVLGVTAVATLLNLAGVRMLNMETNVQNRAATAAQTNFSTDESKALATDIKSINIRTKILTGLKAHDRAWGQLVSDLVSSMPAGASLSRLSINQLDRVVILEGSAKTRGDLLALRDGLLSGKFVDQFEPPLSDLTKRDTIPFSITTHIPQTTLDHYLRAP